MNLYHKKQSFLQGKVLSPETQRHGSPVFTPTFTAPTAQGLALTCTLTELQIPMFSKFRVFSYRVGNGCLTAIAATSFYLFRILIAKGIWKMHL